MSKLNEFFILNAKNLIGWRNKRKVVVFAVDDYGNVRIDSKEARFRMEKAGVKLRNRFDAFDTLETATDLEMLYDVLSSVKDSTGRHAIFTPYALTCNINFERMKEEGYERYIYETLPETFDKLEAIQPAAYSGAWRMLLDGIEKKLLAPQFHGREHLNLKVFREKLQQRDEPFMKVLENRSYTGVANSGYKTISSNAAFDFWKTDELEGLKPVISDGIMKFEKVYGYKPVNFTPPAYNIHPDLYPVLHEHGIKFMDVALIQRIHKGKGRYSKAFNYTGKNLKIGLTILVRNVVFEPTENRGIDWVNYAMKQIEAAFRWNRPAIISSHRVNFCGHIDVSNRKKGLKALRELLQKITQRWPEVEFMAANELGDIIQSGFAE